MLNNFAVWRNLEDHRSTVEAHRENSTRAARSWATYKTTGVGFVVEPVVFKFGCSFLDLPIFTAGVVLDPDGDDLPVDDPPRCTAGVYDWKMTAEGLYAGAFCWFVVDSDTDQVTTNLKMIFTMAWEGIASKDFISAPRFPVNKLDVSSA